MGLSTGDARFATASLSDQNAAGAGSAGKTVRCTAEVATDVDPVIETLRGSRSGIGAVIVTASIEVHAADNRYAILIVCGADCRPVVRHLHDRIRWRNLALDWIGGGVGNVDLGIRFRIGSCRSGIGCGLP